MNSIEAINEAIDNHDQRGIELDWSQQKALLYNFRALIKSKDSGLDERAAEVARLRAVLEVMLASAYPHPTEHPTMTAAWAHAKAALATPPSAAVEAVEAMRKALEATPCMCRQCCPKRCPDWALLTSPLKAPYCAVCGMDYKVEDLVTVQCARCAALAAWKETTRG